MRAGPSTLPSGDPARHRLDLPVRPRAPQLQGAADPGGGPDDEAAAALVVEDEQGKAAGVAGGSSAVRTTARLVARGERKSCRSATRKVVRSPVSVARCAW